MGTFTMIWGRSPKIQPSTTLISLIGKPACKANPKDWGATYSFGITKKGVSPYLPLPVIPEMP
jgi:hypothetical protein